MSEMSRCLLMAPAPVLQNNGEIQLDAKFVEGMRMHAHLWPGHLDCLLRLGQKTIPFGARVVDMAAEPFGLKIMEEDETFSTAHFDGYDVVLCSADDDQNLGVAPLVKAVGAKLFCTLEYALDARLQIVRLDEDRPVWRRRLSALRMRFKERRRMALLAASDGLEANGYPAAEICRRYNADTLLYLDNRMRHENLATDTEMAARRASLESGAPLRLVYSGRLEPLKGVQDLVPVAIALRDRGVAFTLDIFGTGHLKSAIEAAIAEAGLAEQVTLHAPVDFETELVPYLRKEADVFLPCHLQSDPSCSYLENMGCGLAVIGYANAMWAALCDASNAGWSTPMGDPAALAAKIERVDKDRQALIARTAAARDFAGQHTFEAVLKARMSHLGAGAC